MERHNLTEIKNLFLEKTILLDSDNKIEMLIYLEELHSILEKDVAKMIFASEEVFNTSSVTTYINEEPYYIKIEIESMPEHIKTLKSLAYSSIVYAGLRKYWYTMIRKAVVELRGKGVKPFREKTVIYYRFHNFEGIDCDNINIRLINNALKFAELIPDDAFNYVCIFSESLQSSEEKTEIFLINYHNFVKTAL